MSASVGPMERIVHTPVEYCGQHPGPVLMSVRKPWLPNGTGAFSQEDNMVTFTTLLIILIIVLRCLRAAVIMRRGRWY